MTASFNGRPLLINPSITKEETKTNKLAASPFSFGHENAEEEANKRKMR
jgi:hypothetical protein